MGCSTIKTINDEIEATSKENDFGDQLTNTVKYIVNVAKKEKIKILVIPAGCMLVFYLFFKYIFPLIWPLAAAAALAILLYPVVRFLPFLVHLLIIISIIFDSIIFHIPV